MNAQAAVAYMPEDRPEGYTVTTVIDGSYRVLSSSRSEIVGMNLLQVGGMDEAFGVEVRHVISERQSVSVTRYWNAAIWNVTITPNDHDEGATVHGEIISKLTPACLLTLTNLTETVSFVAYVLAEAAKREALQAPPQAPRSSSLGRLRVV